MESWKGLNYYTRDPKGWVRLMNLSTAEWGVGFFPPNVVAIPGKLNSSYSFDPGTIVIQHAAKSKVGTNGIESIIFITASLVSILCTGLWLWRNLDNLKSGGERSQPQNPNPDDASQATEGTALNGVSENRGVSASRFEGLLKHLYYDSIHSELEAWEKDANMEGVTADDVEDAINLLRRMYVIDLEMWARGDERGFTNDQRNVQQWKSDAILAETHRLVDEWQLILQSSGIGATSKEEEEAEEIKEIKKILNKIGDTRYEEKYPIPQPMPQS
ncbi:hypothetical protein BGZ63DRAFT_390056 [Mariannaea sp. PMI_226]|nr:hypothetical protein BGZ63DRAFT_390056 [Mariannaea sp. PMI_226]